MQKGLQKCSREENLSYWAGKVEECRKSGQTVSGWCEENGIKYSTYYRWQKAVFERVLQPCEGKQFAEITPAYAERNTIAAGITINGIRVEIYSGADKGTIKEVIRAIRDA